MLASIYDNVRYVYVLKRGSCFGIYPGIFSCITTVSILVNVTSVNYCRTLLYLGI